MINPESLPGSPDLDVVCLSRCFKNVVNSYKFYWFLSILDWIHESDQLTISFDELSIRMLSSVWYPLDYFKLSFGKQDGFKDLATQISKHMIVDNHITAKSLTQQINEKLPIEISKKLKKQIEQGLMRWVAYRFLTPFFESEIKGFRDHQVNKIIKRLSHLSPYKEVVPYSINDHSLTLNASWRSYFNRNQIILRGFIRWHLVRFLQKNNPNVIGLSEKLEKPQLRDLKIARAYWSRFITANQVNCIYSNEVITIQNLSLDHFIPWSYIAHDQLWNIIPTTRRVNSSKGDILPDLDLYMPRFCDLQFKAFDFYSKNKNTALLQDYEGLFNIQNNNIEFAIFSDKLVPEILNHHRIAKNLGFRTPFIFT